MRAGKYIFFVIILIFLGFSCLYAQKQENKIPGSEKITDTIQQYEQQNQGNQQNQTNTQNEVAAPSFWGPFLFMMLLLLALYFTLKYIRRKKNPGLKESGYMQSLGSLSLSAGAYLEIVEIGERVYVLGVGSSGVNLLFEIEDKELILTIKKRSMLDKHKTFLDILSHIFDKKSIQPVQVDFQKSVFDFLRSQKEKLKNIQGKE